MLLFQTPVLSMFAWLLVQLPPAGSIDGVVGDLEGQPVAGAVVAAVRYGDTEDLTAPRGAATTRSDLNGRFQIVGLADGLYAVTGTTPNLTGGYRGRVRVTKGRAELVTLKLGGEGVLLSGVARNREGAPAAAAEVRALAMIDRDAEAYFAFADQDGKYAVMLPVEPNDRYYVTIVRGESVLAQMPFVGRPPVGAPPPEVSAWLMSHAVPLKSIEPGHGTADMQRLNEIVGEARVVALGEATHGTREFSRLRHRIIEALVAEQGFTAVAIEASMSEAIGINDYVRTGKGSARKALAALDFWTCNTPEVLELIEWMRAWNANLQHKRKLGFYGIDMQSLNRTMPELVAYLGKVEAALANRVRAELGFLTDAEAPALGAATDAVKLRVQRTAAEVVESFDRNAKRWGQALGKDDWAAARQSARLVQQHVELQLAFGGGFVDGVATRDRFMAENVRWVLEHDGPDAKVVLWAHNGHVANRKLYADVDMMGRVLRQALGKAFVTFGVAFDRGSFTAFEIPPTPKSGLRSFQLEPAPQGTLDAAYAATQIPRFAIDLRTLPASGPVRAWFDAGQLTRNVGAAYGEAFADGIWARIDAPEWYDAMLFVREMSASQPHPRTE